MVGSVPRFSYIYPPGGLHKYGVIGPWIFIYLSFPVGGEELFQEYGCLGPWIFLNLSSPRGGEECFHEYGKLGPWIFLYFSSPGGSEDVSTKMLL